LNAKYTLEEVDIRIRSAFGLQGIFGDAYPFSEEFRIILAKAISKLPKQIVDWTTENVLFFSSRDDRFVFTLNIDEWKHKRGFIFLCENLKEWSEGGQVLAIAHEIAHLKLDHRKRGSSEEQEATKLAKQWLKQRKE